jgi:hypothetical protein
LAKIALDVATIRAAGRLLHPEGPRDDDGQFADLDVAALGQLIEAIVLFDEVIVPDLGHRLDVPELVARFGTAVTYQAVHSAVMNDIAGDSQDWLHRSWELDALTVTRLVGVNPSFRMEPGGGGDSSGGYAILLASIGARDKYSRSVVEWIEESRTSEHAKHSLYLRAGGIFSPRRLAEKQSLLGQFLRKWGRRDIDFDFAHFRANLAWLTFRARCYDLYCRRIAVPYMPHPLRTNVAGFSCFADDHPDRSKRSPLVFTYLNAIKKVYQESTATISDALGGAFVPVQCPLLLPHVVAKARKKENVLEAVYDVRDSRGARGLRAHVSQLEQSIAAGDLTSALKLVKELDRLTRSLRRGLGLSAADAPGMAVSIGGVVSAQLSADQVQKLTAKLTRRVTIARPRTMFLRNVFKDLADAATLGPLYEVLYRKNG